MALAAALAFASSSGRDTAVALPEVSPLVSSIVRGGSWKSGDQDGTYRVILACAGWEHVGCSVAIEWVRADQESQADVIVQRVAITGEPDGWAMAVKELRFDPAIKATRLRISATEPHALEAGTFTFTLGPPGVWRLEKRRK